MEGAARETTQSRSLPRVLPLGGWKLQGVPLHVTETFLHLSLDSHTKCAYFPANDAHP